MPIPAAEPARAPNRQAEAEYSAPEQFEPVALVLAAVLPGLGHLYLGRRARAGLIAVGVLGLFFGGMLIGGISVIDRRDNPIWFAGQAMVGPIAFGVDHVHQTYFKVRDRGVLRSANPDEARDPVTAAPVHAGPGQGPPYIKSLGRVNELGTLFATIAGMLNLIVVIDAAWHARRDPAIEQARRVAMGTEP
jgi:hypothetical protein